MQLFRLIRHSWASSALMLYLLTVRTGTVSGKPARNMAILHSLARCPLKGRTEPITTSPIACAAALSACLPGIDTVQDLHEGLEAHENGSQVKGALTAGSTPVCWIVALNTVDSSSSPVQSLSPPLRACSMLHVTTFQAALHVCRHKVLLAARATGQRQWHSVNPGIPL